VWLISRLVWILSTIQTPYTAAPAAAAAAAATATTTTTTTTTSFDLVFNRLIFQESLQFHKYC